MNFWETVDAELEYRGMNRKALADKVGFNLSNVGKGIKLGSIPSADTAVRIARILDVSVEYLVSGIIPAKCDFESEIPLVHKYSKVIKSLESLPEEIRCPIIEMIEKMGQVK